jgi:hypothetical protein
MESSENSLSLLYCALFLILYQSQSAEFCEIVVSLNQDLYSRFFSLVHCVPTIVTSSLFVGFERTSNDWELEKVNYEFGITSF